jgi:hypothetical protein
LEFLGLRGSPQAGSAVAYPPPPQLSMFTDASNFGWGAHVNEVDLTTKGTWSQGSPARCKTLSDPPEEPKSVPVFKQLHS